jgi:hypothetical protein
VSREILDGVGVEAVDTADDRVIATTGFTGTDHAAAAEAAPTGDATPPTTPTTTDATTQPTTPTTTDDHPRRTRHTNRPDIHRSQDTHTTNP